MARRSRPDPKVEALAAARSLNPHPEAVLDEAFATSPFLDPRDLVQVKYEMVRRVRQEGAAVAAAAAAFGFSRPSWYAAAAALDQAALPGVLVDLIAERFGIGVHPRSIDRALARRQYPKSPR